ncbi:MAG: molybdopterin-dependent oxidoreductase, partial [Mycolicibacterium aromaticivorans]|nr:molybdopterin-dependent oxidoreductase [Mycolicibacterium aromaticivorans]
AHYFGAWVFIAGFLVHLAMKIPKMWAGLRSLPFRQVLATSTAETRSEPMDPDGLVAVDPAPATVSRRGALLLVGAASVFMAVITAGQTIGGFTRYAAFLLPRGRDLGDGPNDFEVNKTFAASLIDPRATGDVWRLTLTGGTRAVVLDRAALLSMTQHTATLPIACVEGWSSTQRWTGVPLRNLAVLAGVPNPVSAYVRSLERYGFNQATLQRNQVSHQDSLLALKVNDVDLSPDHGYPARIIVPALPGVHSTKWVTSIDFRAG